MCIPETRITDPEHRAFLVTIWARHDSFGGDQWSQESVPENLLGKYGVRADARLTSPSLERSSSPLPEFDTYEMFRGITNSRKREISPSPPSSPLANKRPRIDTQRVAARMRCPRPPRAPASALAPPASANAAQPAHNDVIEISDDEHAPGQLSTADVHREYQDLRKRVRALERHIGKRESNGRD